MGVTLLNLVLGLGEGSKEILSNGERDEADQPGDEVELGKEEAKEFRGVVGRVNFPSLDRPDLQFPIEQCNIERLPIQ